MKKYVEISNIYEYINICICDRSHRSTLHLWRRDDKMNLVAARYIER